MKPAISGSVNRLHNCNKSTKNPFIPISVGRVFHGTRQRNKKRAPFNFQNKSSNARFSMHTLRTNKNLINCVCLCAPFYMLNRNMYNILMDIYVSYVDLWNVCALPCINEWKLNDWMNLAIEPIVLAMAHGLATQYTFVFVIVGSSLVACVICSFLFCSIIEHL